MRGVLLDRLAVIGHQRRQLARVDHLVEHFEGHRRSAVERVETTIDDLIGLRQVHLHVVLEGGSDTRRHNVSSITYQEALEHFDLVRHGLAAAENRCAVSADRVFHLDLQLATSNSTNDGARFVDGTNTEHAGWVEDVRLAVHSREVVVALVLVEESHLQLREVNFAHVRTAMGVCDRVEIEVVLADLEVRR